MSYLYPATSAYISKNAIPSSSNEASLHAHIEPLSNKLQISLRQACNSDATLKFNCRLKNSDDICNTRIKPGAHPSWIQRILEPNIKQRYHLEKSYFDSAFPIRNTKFLISTRSPVESPSAMRRWSSEQNLSGLSGGKYLATHLRFDGSAIKTFGSPSTFDKVFQPEKVERHQAQALEFKKLLGEDHLVSLNTLDNYRIESAKALPVAGITVTPLPEANSTFYCSPEEYLQTSSSALRPCMAHKETALPMRADIRQKTPPPTESMLLKILISRCSPERLHEIFDTSSPEKSLPLRRQLAELTGELATRKSSSEDLTSAQRAFETLCNYLVRIGDIAFSALMRKNYIEQINKTD